jgi:hypothetical protein
MKYYNNLDNWKMAMNEEVDIIPRVYCCWICGFENEDYTKMYNHLIDEHGITSSYKPDGQGGSIYKPNK